MITDLADEHDFKLLVSADGRTSPSTDDLKGERGSSTVVGPVSVKPTALPPTPTGLFADATAPPPGVPA